MLYIRIAGYINLFTAFLHLIAGQIDLATPLLKSDMTIQQKAELTGVWHMVSVLLFYSTYIILKEGYKNEVDLNQDMLKKIGIYYILGGAVFIITSLWFRVLAPQWMLLMPIGILLLIGLRRLNSE